MNDSAQNVLAAERLEKIQVLVQQHHAVRVDELSRELQVSPATIRRDLIELSNRGRLRKVHGGAVRLEGRLEEAVFEDKTALAAEAKQAIAQRASELIQGTEAIFLDGGSTVLALAHLLHDRSGLTVVTNSLRVASALAGRGPRLLIVGGELRRLSQTFVGSLTEPIIDQLHFDIAFMGTMGLSVDYGLTTTDPAEAFTKKLVMRRAAKTVLLTDSSKIGKVAFAQAGALEDIDVLITDRGLDDASAEALGEAAMEISRVSI